MAARSKDDPRAVRVLPGRCFSKGNQQFAVDNEVLVVDQDITVELARHSINLGWAVACEPSETSGPVKPESADGKPADKGDGKNAGKGAGKEDK